MFRAKGVALASVLALAGALSPGRPAWALGGHNGANFDCVEGSPQVIAQFQDPKQVTGTGTLACPPPGGSQRQPFGPSGSLPASSPPPPTPNTPCRFGYDSPNQFRLNGTGYEWDDLNPSGPGDAPVWTATPFQDLAFMLSRGYVAEQLYMNAGTNDYFTPWSYDGHWNQQLHCVARPTDPGWTTPCRLNGTGTFPACLDRFTRLVFGPPSGVPVGLLGVNLSAFLHGQFGGGVITSLPAPPNPGLTNLPTCFSVSGMTVNGLPADPQQDVFWERIVESPNPVDGEGRHVFFVFVVHVAYIQTTWDFGDGAVVTIPRGGASAEPLPAACRPIANQQFEVAHTYHRYSTGDGFHVTVSHEYGVDVSERWWDSNKSNRVDFPNVIPPVTVPALPLPYFAMPVVQEEGVPIG